MMARIVLAGTPQPELGLGGVVKEGRERGDLADVEGGVRPAVQAMADAGRQRVVHGGVAERAGDAETRHLAEVVDLGADADDGIQSQQGDGDSGVVEALAGADRRDDFGWQRVNVDLEAEPKCRNRGNCADHVVHLQDVGPQLLVAERVLAKNLSAEAMFGPVIVSVTSCVVAD